MKRLFLLVVCVALFCSTAYAGWPPTQKEVTEAIKAAVIMSRKGYVTVDIDNNTAFIEPLGWKGFTTQDKMLFTLTIMRVFSEKRGGNQPYVFIREQVSKDLLATGFLEDGRIELKR
ncbi:hypothetical protein JCM15519_38570 [Fundidesulfovibrio butyratiphilus]